MPYRDLSPSLATLFEIRIKSKNAKAAQELLSRKVLAIELMLRKITSELLSCNEIVEQVSKNAFIKLSEAKYVNEEFAKHVMENIPNQACICVTAESNTLVRMVKTFIFHEDGPKPYPYLGIAKGGTQIKKATEEFKDLLKLLIKQVYLRNAFELLDKERRDTRRKMNVLDKIIVPSYESTTSYIMTILDDMEREDLFRIKKVKQRNLKRNNVNNLKVQCMDNRNFKNQNIFITICENIDISMDNASGITCMFVLFLSTLYQIFRSFI